MGLRRWAVDIWVLGCATRETRLNQLKKEEARCIYLSGFSSQISEIYEAEFSES